MKRRLTCFIFVALLLLAASHAFAQGAPAAEEAIREELSHDEFNAHLFPTLLTIVFSSGLYGVIIWAGIFLWGILAIPLGILSIVQAAKSRTNQWPFATKLLAGGGVWAFILGLTGFAQGAYYGLYNLANVVAGTAAQATLFVNLAHAHYTLIGALLVCQINLFFFLVSLAILHVRNRNLP
jgi:hypothetical protein